MPIGRSLVSVLRKTPPKWRHFGSIVHNAPDNELQRYDWRLRAPSRVHHGKSLAASKRLRRAKNGSSTSLLNEEDPFSKYYSALQTYRKHFLPLLDLEQAEDEAILKERLTSWSIARLQKEGYCLTGLSAFWMEGKKLRLPLASFTLGPGIILPEHRFENGAQVLVSHLDPLKEEPVKGSVVSSTTTHLHVTFQDDKFALDGEWRLDLGSSNVAYDRMREAIARLAEDPADQDLNENNVLKGTFLRDVILRSLARTELDPRAAAHITPSPPPRAAPASSGAFQDNMLIASWATRHLRADPVVVEGDPDLSHLNRSQVRSIALMLFHRFSLVQGPPGTGKTKTLVEAIKLLKVHFEVPQPIMLCTYTNVAVDNVVEGLAAAQLRPLRVGPIGRVRPALLEHALEYKQERHPWKPKVDRLAKQLEAVDKRHKDLCARINELRRAEKRTGAVRLGAMETDLISLDRQSGALWSRMYAVKQDILRDILARSDVVCTTCISSASSLLDSSDFPVVFVDEASMSTEPASLIPLMKGSSHVALIGDHKQLPPVITSPEAQANGLGLSLFERLVEEDSVPSIMLDTQYRMHPNISHFPSREFYNYSLMDGTISGSGEIAAHLTAPSSSHLRVDPDTGHRPSVVFLDHAGAESMKDRSRVNWNEAGIVCSVVEDLLLQNEGMRGEDIGVIAPYAAQISLLTRLLNTDARYQRRFRERLGEHRAMQLARIEIKTVDGFEGREKDVIIFSTVRNNAAGHIGFLADRRRLNVGLTRAKRGLFMVGSIRTLRAGRTYPVLDAGDGVADGVESWRRYARFLDEDRLIVRLRGEELERILHGARGTA